MILIWFKQFFRDFPIPWKWKPHIFCGLNVQIWCLIQQIRQSNDKKIDKIWTFLFLLFPQVVQKHQLGEVHGK